MLYCDTDYRRWAQLFTGCWCLTSAFIQAYVDHLAAGFVDKQLQICSILRNLAWRYSSSQRFWTTLAFCWRTMTDVYSCTRPVGAALPTATGHENYSFSITVILSAGNDLLHHLRRTYCWPSSETDWKRFVLTLTRNVTLILTTNYTHSNAEDAIP